MPSASPRLASWRIRAEVQTPRSCLRLNSTARSGVFCYVAGLPRQYLLGRRAGRVVGTLGAGGAIGSGRNPLSIPGLGLAATSGLSGRYPIRVLVRGCTFARIRVVSSSRLTIAANGLSACVFGATCLT
jgi:hypothetical protein